MIINEVIEMAKYGELSKLSIKDDNNAILSYINLGLIELYKRFPLKYKEVVVELSENVTIYTLPEDLIHIDTCYSEDGEPVPINDETSDLSILTPTPTTIQVPQPADDTALSIIYVAYPVSVVAVSDELELPKSLLEALLHYVGYRGHGSVNGEINTENNTHYMRFNASCNKAKELGVLTADTTANYKLEDRGFV